MPWTVEKKSVWAVALLAVIWIPATLVLRAKPAGTAPADARAIAKDAYIYGFPVVANYKVMYAYEIDEKNPEYKGPFNTIFNVARVYTPADKAIIRPNSDTPYSFLWADLQREPLVVTVAKVEPADRYWSMQTDDAYTNILPYVGTRTTGNKGGKYMLAGPTWQRPKPDGIDMVIQSPTHFALAGFRTQLFGPDDLDNVKKIQAGYKVQTLSEFLGRPAPKAPPKIVWPVYTQKEAGGLGFYNYLAFMLHYCLAMPEDTELRKRMMLIGIEQGKPFRPELLSPKMKEAMELGMQDGIKAIDEAGAKLTDTSALFGSRRFYDGNFLNRAVGAKNGIYGNAKEEAMYPAYVRDASDEPFDGSKSAYVMHFAPETFPPVQAFWSLTVYDGSTFLLVENPIKRYLINSPMLPSLTKDPDGGVTLYLQKDSPGTDKEANWLPVPDGPFVAQLRLYGPKQQALDGKWQAPPLEKVP
jgi:hypothetical protein